MTARVLLVCMGNICRSPTAEAVLRRKVEAAGLAERVLVDSAGTHGYHSGEPPDARAEAAARRRGYEMKHLRARQVTESDFAEFDFVLAMDTHNLKALEKVCPPEHRRKLGLLMAYGERNKVREVPDPYYGPAAGFDRVLDLVEDAAGGLVKRLAGMGPPGERG